MSFNTRITVKTVEIKEKTGEVIIVGVDQDAIDTQVDQAENWLDLEVDESKALVTYKFGGKGDYGMESRKALISILQKSPMTKKTATVQEQILSMVGKWYFIPNKYRK